MDGNALALAGVAVAAYLYAQDSSGGGGSDSSSTDSSSDSTATTPSTDYQNPFDESEHTGESTSPLEGSGDLSDVDDAEELLEEWDPEGSGDVDNRWPGAIEVT